MIDLSYVHSKYEFLTKKLIELNLQVSTMESCTSGFVASLITDTEGASSIFKGAFITYSNEVKVLNGVSASVIEKYGVYSKETASEMACKCRENVHSDIGIGVTGTFGNIDENNLDSVQGNIYFAIDYKGEVSSFHIELKEKYSRFEYKLIVASEIESSLEKILKI